MAQQNYLNLNYRHVKSVNPALLNSNAFFTNHSESMARFMTEKIISLTMTHLFEQSIINAIPEFCFSDLKRAIDPYVKISFIAYDRDDFDLPLLKEDVGTDDEPIQINRRRTEFFENIEQIEKVEDNHSHHSQQSHHSQPSHQSNPNPQPNSSSNASSPSHRSHHSVLKSASFFYDNLYEGVNNWDIPLQPQSVVIDRDASTIIPYEKMPPEKEGKEDEDHSMMSQKKERKEYTYSIKKRKDKVEPKKKKGQQPLEIVSYDIPKELIFNVNETEELAQMRIDREKEIIQRELENRRRKKKVEENLEQMNEVAKKQKEFEYENITVDSNGAIVFIRDVQPELFPLEFKGPTFATKEVQLIKAEPVKLPVLPGPKRKSIVYNKSPEKDKAESKFKLVAKGVVTVVNAMQPEKKADLKEEKLYREKYSIQPSGSAFDVIKLEVGVALHEETKYKTGGKDFYKKYKKYSVENFQTTQSKGASQYEVSFPKEKKAEKEEEKIKATETEVNYVNINTEPSSTVKVLNVKTKSLKNAIEKLDLITEEQEKAPLKKFNRTRPGDMYKRVKPIQIEGTNTTHFSKADKLSNTQTSFNEMNQFAKTIVSNQAWGTNPMKFKEAKPNPKVPTKPQLSDIQKELPGGILNTKMPRGRKFAYVNKDNQGMNNTTTTGFFKVVPSNKYKPEMTQPTFKQKEKRLSGKDNLFSKTVTDNLFKD